MGMNGQFVLVMKNDGTYIQLVPPSQSGDAVDFNELDEYLIQCHIEFDRLTVNNELHSLTDQAKEIKLDSIKRVPEPEHVRVIISEDKRMVTTRFYPPSQGGAFMNRTEIINDLVKAGVKYGVIEEALDSFLRAREYFTDIILARALPCQEGKDAEIMYHFNTNLSMKPHINEDGSVDFHRLENISHVAKNAILATLTPAVMGQPGINVCGEPIVPRKVIQKKLSYANKITLSEDKLRIYSDVDGHASLVEGKVFVSDSFEIPNDVDASTGDVTYEGNVVIKGCVRTGYKVETSGDIVVEGVVEGATLKAGGQILLKRGIQGMNKGVLIAGGNIVTRFIENATVTTNGFLTTEAILHSIVSAKKDITVGGRKGYITGGEIRSGTMISVKTAGSTMGTNTLIEVGVDPQMIEEYHQLEKEIPGMAQELERINQNLILYLKKIKNGEKLAVDKILLVKNLSTQKETIETKQQQTIERLNQLQTYMDEHDSGCINVSDTIYSGCKVVIAGVVYFVRKELIRCTLIRDRADVVAVPYRG